MPKITLLFILGLLMQFISLNAQSKEDSVIVIAKNGEELNIKFDGVYINPSLNGFSLLKFIDENKCFFSNYIEGMPNDSLDWNSYAQQGEFTTYRIFKNKVYVSTYQGKYVGRIYSVFKSVGENLVLIGMVKSKTQQSIHDYYEIYYFKSFKR